MAFNLQEQSISYGDFTVLSDFSLSIKKGEKVAIGDVVGAMGSTGRSTGPHLHYEVWFNNKPYDPVEFLKAGKHVHEE